MLKEAKQNKYYIDGLFIKLTGHYPYDQPSDFCYEQRVFLVYLFAMLPSVENINTSLVFSGRLQEIQEKDFTKEIPIDNALRAIAFSKRISAEEYQKISAKELQRAAIIKLYREHSLEIPDDIKVLYNIKTEAPKHEKRQVPPSYDREKIKKMLGIKNG